MTRLLGHGMNRLSRQSGRSLTELLIVVAIIGIMAAMAGPSYQAMTARAQARSAAVEIASVLRMARQLAMARRERLLVRFDLSDQTITLHRVEDKAVLETYQYAEKGIMLEEPTAGPDLFFHPSGRSATATTIIVHDRHGRPRTLTVSLTGRVVIS